MSIDFAVYLVRIFYAYTGVGFALLPWWHLAGLRRLDVTAAAGSWGFRILISFGLVALWPWLLLRARWAAGHPPSEHNAHRDNAHRDHALRETAS